MKQHVNVLSGAGKSKQRTGRRDVDRDRTLTGLKLVSDARPCAGCKEIFGVKCGTASQVDRDCLTDDLIGVGHEHTLDPVVLHLLASQAKQRDVVERNLGSRFQVAAGQRHRNFGWTAPDLRCSLHNVFRSE